MSDILSISQLSNSIKQIVESGFSFVKVQGEISSYKQHTSGHHYFALKDKDAVIDGICWRGTRLSTPLQDGLDIIAIGRITTYPMRSKYQMIVEQALPAGQGELQKLLKERFEKFKKMGYFDLDRKKALPRFPMHIGIITSPTGAVIRDILHRISDRFPCHITIWPTLVQGPGAEKQIACAIKGFNTIDQKPDLIIVARGGGSIEDLWTFNEEDILHAVYESVIPVISAVGHETDTTLIDYVSDRRAPTPTAAAEMAVPVKMDILYQIQQIYHSSYLALTHYLKNLTLEIRSMQLISPAKILEEKILRLDDLSERMHTAMYNKIKTMFLHFEKQKLRIPCFDTHKMKLDFVCGRIVRSMSIYLQKCVEKVTHLSLYLDQSSIEKILKKGFCAPLDDKGKIVSRAQILERESFFMYFHDGKLKIQSKAALEVA